MLSCGFGIVQLDISCHPGKCVIENFEIILSPTLPRGDPTMTKHSYPQDSRPSKKPPINPPDITRFCLTSSVASSVVDLRCRLICSFLHLSSCFVYVFFNSLPVHLHSHCGWQSEGEESHHLLQLLQVFQLSGTKIPHTCLYPLQSGWLLSNFLPQVQNCDQILDSTSGVFLHTQLNLTCYKSHHHFHILWEGSSGLYY